MPTAASRLVPFASHPARPLAILLLFTFLIGLCASPQPVSASTAPQDPSAKKTLEEPTIVWVAAFQAERPTGDFVQLSWMTGAEIDMIGFNIYREDSNGNKNGPINPQIIFTTQFGEMIGDSYTYLDTDANPGAIENYWLEVIRATDDPLVYGPAEIIRTENFTYLPALFSAPR